MAKKLFTDPIVQNEIFHSRRRIMHSKSVLQSSRSVIDASLEAIRTSHEILTSLPEHYSGLADQSIVQNPLIAMDDETISQLVSDLTAAYVEARETGDTAGVDIIGKALEIIGRYLAAELGPKGSGVPIS